MKYFIPRTDPAYRELEVFWNAIQEELVRKQVVWRVGFSDDTIDRVGGIHISREGLDDDVVEMLLGKYKV